MDTPIPFILWWGVVRWPNIIVIFNDGARVLTYVDIVPGHTSYLLDQGNELSILQPSSIYLHQMSALSKDKLENLTCKAFKYWLKQFCTVYTHASYYNLWVKYNKLSNTPIL